MLGIWMTIPVSVKLGSVSFSPPSGNASSFNLQLIRPIAYESIQHLRPAVEAYRRAGIWDHSLSLATLIPYTPEELSELTLTLADHLVETKSFQDAATIYSQYRHDIPEAARVLCKGSHFSEAMRLVTLHNKPELLNSVIDAGLIEQFNITTELITDCKSQAYAQVSRLCELRTKKEEDPLAYFEGGVGGEGNIPDNISVAPTDTSTSGGTFMTKYTGKTGGTALTGATRRTSKNRRREERKRARGKKGTVYEEEYLVNSIERLIQRVENVVPDAQQLVEGMVRRGMMERAGAVQSGVADLTGRLREVVEEVFRDESALGLWLEGGVGAGDDGGGVREGDGVGGSGEGRRKREVPVVKEFEGLKLL